MSLHKFFSVAMLAALTALSLSACEPAPPAEDGSTSEPTSEAPISTEGDVVAVAAILVIDDFLGGGGDTATTGDSPNCVFVPDEQGSYGAREAWSVAGNLPHGELVAQVIEDQLLTRGGSWMAGGEPTPVPPATHPAGVKIRGIWKTADGYIVTVSVDTAGFKTDVISQQIESSVNWVSHSIWDIDGNQINGIDRIVLNMSFAIVPCDLYAYAQGMQTYAEKVCSQQEFQDLAASLGASCDALATNPIFAYKSEIGYKENIGEGDAIRTLLRALLDTPTIKIIPVAAAGNWGPPLFDFPFVPGLWPEVLSVSALEGTTRAPTNPGEVAANGTFGSVEGSSFAAPIVSYLSAVYLLQASSDECNGIKPPLGRDPVYGYESVSDVAQTQCTQFPLP